MAFCNSGIWESKVFVFGFAFVANRVSKIIFVPLEYVERMTKRYGVAKTGIVKKEN